MRDRRGAEKSYGGGSSGATGGRDAGRRTLTQSLPVRKSGALTDAEANRRTNAAFYARHPELAGQPLAKDSPLVGEWLEIRKEIVARALAEAAAPPPPSAPPPAATVVSQEAPPAAPSPSEPGLLDKVSGAIDTVEDAVAGLANSAYERISGWFGDEQEPPPAPATTTPPVTTPPAPKTPAPAAPKTPVPADFAAGEGRFHTKDATIAGNTLDIAGTRAALGDAGTRYQRTGLTDAEQKALAQSLMSGDVNATDFYCSGFGIWTLAAAGYDMWQTMAGADGVPYTWTKVSKKKDKKSKEEHEVETETTITLKQLIDGDPRAVETMTRVQRLGMKNGGSVGRLSRDGAGSYEMGQDGEPDPHGVKGFAGAFVLAGIGVEVDELQQKPGDFAQSRHMSKAAEIKTEDDKEVRHRGAGHAWQVNSVHVKGSALFGEEGSPRPTGKQELVGWQVGVEYVIDNGTDPALVGEHTVLKATRMEANVGTAAGFAKTADSDGGVQVTGEVGVPAKSTKPDFHLYYGRLGASRWLGWTPAKAK